MKAANVSEFHVVDGSLPGAGEGVEARDLGMMRTLDGEVTRASQVELCVLREEGLQFGVESSACTHG